MGNTNHEQEDNIDKNCTFLLYECKIIQKIQKYVKKKQSMRVLSNPLVSGEALGERRFAGMEQGGGRKPLLLRSARKAGVWLFFIRYLTQDTSPLKQMLLRDNF
jgi:hypothetical protein